jgi:hypothetical protein
VSFPLDRITVLTRTRRALLPAIGCVPSDVEAL